MHHGAGLWPLFGMWAAMMVAMMVPVEAPALWRLARARTPLAGAAAFTAGYLAPWIAFSLLAAILQERLHALGLLGHHSGAITSTGICAGLVIAAGILQF